MDSLINRISRVASTRVLIFVLLCVGFYALWISSRMAYKFGSTISPDHASGLVIATILAAFMFSARDIFKARGDKFMAMFALVIGGVAVSAELWSHIGYTVGQRHGNVVNATVQQTKYDDVRDSVAKAQANLASARRQLEQLQTANGWAASASATAMRAQLAEKQAAAEREAARVRCGRKCEIIKSEVMALQGKISVLERRKSYEDQIAATVKWLESAKAKAEKTDVGESSVVEQALLPAKLISMSLDPDKTSIGWAQIIIGLFMAVVQTLLAPGAITTAFRLANVSHTDDIPAGPAKIDPDPAPAWEKPIAPKPTAPHAPRQSIEVTTIADILRPGMRIAT
ncbi:MAG: hypothetical protein AB7G35_07975 [Hyphomicrobiaceae bacterium]